MTAAILALLPVFLLIVLGIVLRRTLMPDDSHWIGPERLVYYVMFPALLIDTLARADLKGVPVAGVGGALAGAVLLMAALCLALRPLLMGRGRMSGPSFTSLFQGATRWQTFVGLAVAGNLFGDPGVVIASVAMVAMIPLLNILCVSVLARYATDVSPSWLGITRALMANPFIWACFIGVALNLAGVPIPAALHAFGDALGRSSLALGLLMVGSGLQLGALLRPAPATVIATVLKLALMPAMAIGLAVLFGLSGINLAVVAICASVPSASNAYVLARQMGGDAELIAQILTVQTLLAVLTMPIVLALVGS
ncbi:MAG: Auxin Efflux Carrier [Xanthobacteraceae bacterium]|jgi:predicted permease|nr:Auxin Efflux Carrier [Xanthobacteraceae bacterium]